MTAPRTAPRAGQAPALACYNPVTTPDHHPPGGWVGGSSDGLPDAGAGLAAELHIQLDGQVGSLQGTAQVSQCFGLDLLA